ncbi:hypothetical protein BN938_1438 [Mucinivorans hirudinis]|uniref:Putative manganese efflux pump MntP n=1 Tax=Mucinivorans hirudinis TaxID=1433126 RepID=A0A060R827_9BACT|nr:hypothetical protein BN938_1438 [Mucinivorans hirudinis]
MNLLTILLFAVGLCFDSFAVSLSCGMVKSGLSVGRGIRFAAILALMQGVMPLVGWLVASEFQRFIDDYDHWVAFLLLLFLGGKMILAKVFAKGSEAAPAEVGEHTFSLHNSFLLGLATSIDALIAGAAMALVNISIAEVSQFWNMMIAVGVILVVTFAASGLGLIIGRKSSSHIGDKAEIIGGVILIAIGTKILVEHLA